MNVSFGLMFIKTNVQIKYVFLEFHINMIKFIFV